MKVNPRIIQKLPADAVLVDRRELYSVYHSRARKTRVYWLWEDGTVESF